MSPRSDDGLVLWPRYFEARLTRSEGRRVAEDLAVQDPGIEAIAEAAEELGYEAHVDPEAKHPRRSWTSSGRVVVAGADDKEGLLKEIGAALAQGNG